MRSKIPVNAPDITKLFKTNADISLASNSAVAR
jgi:hypothetical protein